MLRGAQLELRMLVLLVLLSVVLSLISPYFFTLNLDRQVFPAAHWRPPLKPKL
jgi:hypothetical protein